MPALSATLTISTATMTCGQTLNCKLVVSNASGTDINIMSVSPTCIFTGDPAPSDGASAKFGPVPLGQGFNQIVPAGSSTTLLYSGNIYKESTKNDDSGSGTYSVGCVIQANDGETLSPTPQTVTVHPVLPIF